MDEPTNGLDIPSKVQFRKIVSAALTENRCVLISTHQVRDLENLIDVLIVLDDRRSIPELAMRTARFYAHESCGQCVPCREGTNWVYHILKRMVHGEGRKKDIQIALDACSNMAGKTICVLSDACAMPITSMLKKFRNEFEAIAREDHEVAPALPLVSGQMGGLLSAIRERQNTK